MLRENPWTLTKKSEENVKKEKPKKERSVKKVLEKAKAKFTEDVAVSTYRVRKLFEDNKEKVYSNQDIASALGISLGTVSCITNRLEALHEIKIVKVRQLVSALSQVFQHREGSMNYVEKEKSKKDTALLVKELFEKDKNYVFTRKNVSEAIPDRSKGQIDESIRILLLTNTIKLVGNSISGKAQFQHIKGDMKGIEVLAEPNENYCSLKEFLEVNNAEHNEEYFKKALSKKQHKRLYSTKGLITVWSKRDLEEILKNSKSLIRRIFGDK